MSSKSDLGLSSNNPRWLSLKWNCTFAGVTPGQHTYVPTFCRITSRSSHLQATALKKRRGLNGCGFCSNTDLCSAGQEGEDEGVDLVGCFPHRDVTTLLDDLKC
jgi:hypothetical protein